MLEALAKTHTHADGKLCSTCSTAHAAAPKKGNLLDPASWDLAPSTNPYQRCAATRPGGWFLMFEQDHRGAHRFFVDAVVYRKLLQQQGASSCGMHDVILHAMVMDRCGMLPMWFQLETLVLEARPLLSKPRTRDQVKNYYKNTNYWSGFIPRALKTLGTGVLDDSEGVKYVLQPTRDEYFALFHVPDAPELPPPLEFSRAGAAAVIANLGNDGLTDVWTSVCDSYIAAPAGDVSAGLAEALGAYMSSIAMGLYMRQRVPWTAGITVMGCVPWKTIPDALRYYGAVTMQPELADALAAWLVLLALNGVPLKNCGKAAVRIAGAIAAARNAATAKTSSVVAAAEKAVKLEVPDKYMSAVLAALQQRPAEFLGPLGATPPSKPAQAPAPPAPLAPAAGDASCRAHAAKGPAYSLEEALSRSPYHVTSTTWVPFPDSVTSPADVQSAVGGAPPSCVFDPRGMDDAAAVAALQKRRSVVVARLSDPQGDATLEALVDAHAVALHTLEIATPQSRGITAAGFATLGRCVNLMEVSFTDVALTDLALRNWAAASRGDSNVRSLSVTGALTHSEEMLCACIERITKNGSLNAFRLRFASPTVGDNTLNTLRRAAPTLQQLDLSLNGTETTAFVSCRGFDDLLCGCQHLRVVDVTGTLTLGDKCVASAVSSRTTTLRCGSRGTEQPEVADMIPNAIATTKAVHLTDLDCSRGKCITDAGLVLVAETCPSLRIVNVSYNLGAITDTGLAPLARCCKQLTHVAVGYCNVTASSLATLASNCPDLVAVDLSCSPLLQPQCPCDSAVAAFATKCQKLRFVAANGINVSDATIQLLSALPELEGLSIDADITEQAKRLSAGAKAHAAEPGTHGPSAAAVAALVVKRRGMTRLSVQGPVKCAAPALLDALCSGAGSRLTHLSASGSGGWLSGDGLVKLANAAPLLEALDVCHVSLDAARFVAVTAPLAVLRLLVVAPPADEMDRRKSATARCDALKRGVDVCSRDEMPLSAEAAMVEALRGVCALGRHYSRCSWPL